MKKKNYNKPSTSTSEQRRNKIYAIILACAMVFWTIASLLGTFAFARTLTGSAETATVREVERKSVLSDRRFQEVNLNTGGITWSFDENYMTNPCFTLFDTSIRLYENGDYELVLGGETYSQSYAGESVVWSVPAEFVTHYADQDNVFSERHSETAIVSYEPIYFFEQPSGGDYRGAYVRRVNCTADAVKYTSYFFITYQYELLWYDVDGVYLGSDVLYLSTEDFSVYGSSIDIIYPATSSFTYISTSSIVNCGSWNTNYNYYYDNGYNAGSLDGFDSGYRAGDVAGYQRGVEDAGNYTFFTLISAVVDAPIQAFTGLFNFDLLGVNLADFFFALLTVATIIAVIRLFL